MPHAMPTVLTLLAVAELALATPADSAVHHREQSARPVTSIGWNSGVYPGNGIDRAAAATFARYRGRRLDNVRVFLEDRSWRTIGHESWEVRQYTGFPRRLVIDMPLLPRTGGGTLGEVAAGRHDASFRAMAQTIVSLGRRRAIIVLGSEFNGDWETYSAFDPKAFVAAFRHVAHVLKSVSPKFAIDWTGNAIDNQAGHNPFAEDYPGDDVVDIVGVNVYEHPDSRIRNRGFRRWLRQPFGLSQWAAFARRHHKPFSVPEWGLTADGGDDPAFVRGMFRFFKAHARHLAFEDYFNQPGPPSSNSLNDPVLMPRSSKVYASLWSRLPPPHPGDRTSSRTT